MVKGIGGIAALVATVALAASGCHVNKPYSSFHKNPWHHETKDNREQVVRVVPANVNPHYNTRFYHDASGDWICEKYNRRTNRYEIVADHECK